MQMNPRERHRQEKLASVASNRWQLLAYDVAVFLAVLILLLIMYSDEQPVPYRALMAQSGLALVCIFGCRLVGDIYRQIWRYGGIECYIRLLVTDFAAALLFLALGRIPGAAYRLPFERMLACSALNLIGALSIRMIYRYAYKCGNTDSARGRFLLFLLRTFSSYDSDRPNDSQKIKIAIIGAGRVGVSLAEELTSNPSAVYLPRCFVDISSEKIGRSIHGIPVYQDDENIFTTLRALEIQEIVFAIPTADAEKKQRLYERFKQSGCKIKVYDFPTMQMAGGKRHMREFDVEELLFRKPLVVVDEKTREYYRDKVVLITGGGGSIGSELCRQIAKMAPRQIIVLDIYENGAYDVQQELKIASGGSLDLRVEIASITNEKAMRRVFEQYHPQVVINAAAHKHVPLMETNCIEAIENNVFGCKVVIDLCEEFGTERFMMVSTDKAVNPTNVMGATKRMCEMLVQSASVSGRVKYSCTRFGNVLGSAGSVIPLFKRQIASGGPVTLTDKRIIRYFMTIPEASQLVLTSGAMAQNGELFVLDMGQPVKILDLAENMIRLSGVQGIEIVETGLRPGEKLYEELLVKTEKLDKTENDLIFIEHDVPLSPADMEQKLRVLRAACDAGDDGAAREALRSVVPTYHRPEEINRDVGDDAKSAMAMNRQGIAV